MKVWYRFNDTHKACTTTVELDTFPVIREGPSSATLDFNGVAKMVHRNAVNAWAHSTPELALIAYRRRKELQAEVAEAEARKARRIIEAIDADGTKFRRYVRFANYFENADGADAVDWIPEGADN